jgi:hypothetical protein
VKRLESIWRRYRTTVMPADAHAVQTVECRRAFYAGAEAMLQATLAAFDGSTPEPTDGDIAVMGEIQRELTEFAQQVKDGLA